MCSKGIWAETLPERGHAGSHFQMPNGYHLFHGFIHLRQNYECYVTLSDPVPSWHKKRLFPVFLFPLQALHNENMSLKAELQNLQAQISDQVSYVPRTVFPDLKGLCVLLFDTPSLCLTLPMQTASQLALDQFQKRCV